MLRNWKPLGVSSISLTPGKLCPGLPPLFWVWTTKKANRSLGQEARLLCSHLVLTSKMPLISLSMIFWPLIWLRVNILTPPPPPPSTAKWYKVGQPCYEDKIQELNTDFSKICISPKPFGAPMGKVPLPVLKELEHQGRQNISTINFMAAFAKTSFSCNSVYGISVLGNL